MNESLTVTIMAAGEGKRMNSTLPKILHLFNGKPMLIRIIEEVLKLVPSKIIIITGRYDLLIKSTIYQYITELNKIIFVQQKNPVGTGDAIKSTLDKYSNNENVLILNGDMPLIKVNLLEKFIDINRTTDLLAKLLVAELDDPYGYGRIIYDSKNNFIDIKEDKDCNSIEKNIKIVNVGIYLFKSSILKKYIPMITNNNVQKEYYLTDIIKIIKNNSDIEIKTYLVEDNMKHQINGVNTQEELINLQDKYKLL